MRSTVTLDPDTRALVERYMRERKVGFKEAINSLIRSGSRDESHVREQYTVVRDLGQPNVDLTKALRLAEAIDDERILAKMRAGR